MKKTVFLDCTLRDGGYYNAWDFERELIEEYLRAMAAVSVDYVEIGFRGLVNKGFKGACAFTTDSFLNALDIPRKVKIGVMVNASELVSFEDGPAAACKKLFSPADSSPVSLVRIACHIGEFESALAVSTILKDMGYLVGYNLMQIAGCPPGEITRLASLASEYPLDVLYFADSLGGLTPEHTGEIISALRKGWNGPLGIHTHDNLGFAMSNTLASLEQGVTWVDSTVTGMGRGPGNVKTEYLALEMADLRNHEVNIEPLMNLVRTWFLPMQKEYGWGTNTYYYLAGKYDIHPTYIQEMLSDSRFSDEDILSVIEHLRKVGGKKFIAKALEVGRSFYQGEARGKWKPADLLQGRTVMIVGPGKSVNKHIEAISSYIRKDKPFVIALNAHHKLPEEYIDARAACHPIRLLADCENYAKYSTPLIAPAGMLPQEVRKSLAGTKLLDFGVSVSEEIFDVFEKECILPAPLVIAYALAVATAAGAANILLAGLDGYGADDPRRKEVDQIFRLYEKNERSVEFYSITPTKYEIATRSVYAL